MSWALQDAKARLSEVIQRALREGPQEVTVRGEPTAVVISKKEFDALRANDSRSRKSFDEFLLSGEPWPDDFVDELNNQPKRYARDIEF